MCYRFTYNLCSKWFYRNVNISWIEIVLKRQRMCMHLKRRTLQNQMKWHMLRFDTEFRHLWNLITKYDYFIHDMNLQRKMTILLLLLILTSSVPRSMQPKINIYMKPNVLNITHHWQRFDEEVKLQPSLFSDQIWMIYCFSWSCITKYQRVNT